MSECKSYEQNKCGCEQDMSCCERSMGGCEECMYGCIGYAYVPMQRLGMVYDEDTALTRGSLFPTLDLPICEYGKVCRECGGNANG